MRVTHFTNESQTQDGCKTASRHIGAYTAVSFEEFKKLPTAQQCQRCLNGKVFALWTRKIQGAAA